MKRRWRFQAGQTSKFGGSLVGREGRGSGGAWQGKKEPGSWVEKDLEVLLRVEWELDVLKREMGRSSRV